MKKRLIALALCLVFTGSLIAVPKARASMVGAGAAAVGAAVLATYMAASGLTINTDSAETIATGLDSLAEDYLTDTGSTETADSWLSTIAGLVTIPGAGVLQLPASVVRMVGGFVDWLTEAFGLTEEGSDATPHQFSGIRTVDGHAILCPSKYASDGKDYLLDVGTRYYLTEDDGFYAIYTPTSFNDTWGWYGTYDFYLIKDGVDVLLKSGSGNGPLGIDPYRYYIYYNSASTSQKFNFYNYALKPDGTLSGAALFCSSKDNEWHQFFLNLFVTETLSVSRGAGFTDIVKEKYTYENDDRPLNIFVPSTITTLDDLSTTVPDQIASNTFNVTYELTQEGTGEGTDTEDGTGADDTTVGLLQSILQGVKAIPDAFTNSLTDVFTPSQEAVDSLAAEVDAKLPLIPTLQNFGGDLVDKLQHPEQCANGLGLTTVVDLGKGRGTYLGNTQHDIFNVSWYLEYKPLVDDIIVGFCWLCFLWNCYGALPRIIHGEGSIAGVFTMIREDGSDDS